MARRDELLRAEAEGWEELVALVDPMADDLFIQAGVNADGWTARDLAWHVAFWCSDAARALGEMRDGTFDRAREPDGPAQVDRVNGLELDRSRAMQPEAVRVELHRARSAMLERFGVLAELTAEAEECFEESGALHYAQHVPQLDTWVRAQRR